MNFQIAAPRAACERPRSPTTELLILAAPMVAMTVSRMLMGFIDFVMVSRLGTAAQAAISPSTLLLFVIACLGMGMAQGVQTFVSQAEGRGEPGRGGAYVGQIMYVAILAMLASAPIAWLTATWFPWVGRAGHHPADVQSMEIQFLQWGLWSIGPMTACAGLEAFYNGVKRPRIPLLGVLVSLATIAIGNFLLIFGHFGFPKMGIAGSGLATLLAWCARLIVLLIPLISRAIDAKYGIRAGMRFDAAKVAELIRVGGPISLQWLVDVGAWFVFLELMMPPFGKIEMAAAALSIQFMHLSFMPAIGIGIALTTQVGNAVGADRPDEAEMRVRVARRLICGYMTIMSLVFVLAGRPLATLLCSESDVVLRAAVIASAAHVLLWVALFQFSDALCIVYSFASRGAGDTRVPAMLFAVCCWGIFVGGGYATTQLLPGWGVNGPWSMCSLYIIVLSALLWRRFHSRAWQTIRLFHPAGSAQAGEQASTVIVEPAPVANV
ncbi:MAG: Multidrug resistance protein NorM [Phycisphaerae bacterium]|nr:Multidrug resistance protein NorM [Phycisphaerae bacterium]